MELTHMSLCSGIGGIDLAAEWAGFRTIAQCETDEYASKVLAKNFKGVPNLHDIRTVGNERLAEYGIDRGAITVLSAGIGDVSKLKNHRVIAEYSLVPDDDNPYIIPNVPLRVTQLYSGEEVEKMAKERKELKDELRSKVEYIHEQDEVIKEYKHRAEVAERALLHALETAICDGQCPECDIKFAGSCKGTDKDIRDCAALDVEDYLQQAEKELAEEGKDENY